MKTESTTYVVKLRTPEVLLSCVPQQMVTCGVDTPKFSVSGCHPVDEAMTLVEPVVFAVAVKYEYDVPAGMMTVAGTAITVVSRLRSETVNGLLREFGRITYWLASNCPVPRRMVLLVLKLRMAAPTFTDEDVPVTPAAPGVIVVVPAANPRMTMFDASCPTGMKAGSGETCAMFAVP